MKVLRWITIGLCAITFCFVSLWLFIEYTLDFDFSNLDESHNAARTEFLASLDHGPGCLSRDVIVQQAQSRGWDVKDEDEPRWCHRPQGLQDWLRVTVEPFRFMATDDENAIFFGFNQDGCRVDWSFSSC